MIRPLERQRLDTARKQQRNAPVTRVVSTLNKPAMDAWRILFQDMAQNKKMSSKGGHFCQQFTFGLQICSLGARKRAPVRQVKRPGCLELGAPEAPSVEARERGTGTHFPGTHARTQAPTHTRARPHTHTLSSTRTRRYPDAATQTHKHPPPRPHTHNAQSTTRTHPHRHANT